jgi:hypothetical protein
MTGRHATQEAQMTSVPAPIATRSPGSIALFASAAVGVVGIVFIVLMYASFVLGAREAGMRFGWINDVSAIIQYPLAVPGVLAIGAALRPGTPRLWRYGIPLALAGIGVIVVFQALLVAGVLTFEQEIGPATVGFLAFGAWMVLAAVAGRRAGVLPVGPGLALLAALYVGYPLWALRIGRWMEASAVESVAEAAPTATAH